jgi:chromosome partitioning protein
MHRAETAAFLNQKGGVGKTTSTVNVGAGLTILGKKVLLIDLDPQGHLTEFLGIGADRFDYTIYDVMRGRVHPREAIITRPLRAKIYMGDSEVQLSMSVIPASLELADADSVFANTFERDYLLKRAIARINGDYDYIIFDCPPSLGFVTTNALVASKKVFIPVQAEYLAMRSLDRLMEKIESVMEELNPDLTIGGIIATRYDGRKVLSRSVLELLRQQHGALLLDTVIRENIVLAESPRFGKDVFSYRPRSYGMEDYLNLSMEIMGRIAAANTLFTVERGVIRNNIDNAVQEMEGITSDQ